jgi:hypothetical protein
MGARKGIVVRTPLCLFSRGAPQGQETYCSFPMTDAVKLIKLHRDTTINPRKDRAMPFNISGTVRTG